MTALTWHFVQLDGDGAGPNVAMAVSLMELAYDLKLILNAA